MTSHYDESIPEKGLAGANGGYSRWNAGGDIVKILLPAGLAVLGSYMAVERRITAVEVRIEERTEALRERLKLIEARHEREDDRSNRMEPPVAKKR